MSYATREAGRKYLVSKAAEPGVYKFPSGLLVKVLNKGKGTMFPLIDTECTCHFEGSFIDGKVFDSSYRRNKPIKFAPNQVRLPGWKEALQMMREGDKWQITLPYEIAYGYYGAGCVIPMYSALNYDLELIKIHEDTVPASDEVFQKHFQKKYEDM